MRNTKGQALVEFVIILPVILILVFCLADFGRIISTKNELENATSDVVTYYSNGDTIDTIRSKINQNMSDVTVEINSRGDYSEITLSKKLKPITPGLNKIDSKVFNVKSTRVIRND